MYPRDPVHMFLKVSPQELSLVYIFEHNKQSLVFTRRKLVDNVFVYIETGFVSSMK